MCSMKSDPIARNYNFKLRETLCKAGYEVIKKMRRSQIFILGISDDTCATHNNRKVFSLLFGGNLFRNLFYGFLFGSNQLKE